jgi:hypothetical protein
LDETPCTLVEGRQRCENTYCRCLQGQRVSNSFACGLLSDPDDEAVLSSEMLVNIYWAERRHISEDSKVIGKDIPGHN